MSPPLIEGKGGLSTASSSTSLADSNMTVSVPTDLNISPSELTEALTLYNEKKNNAP